MTAAIDRLLTLDEFLELPETQPEYEFIAGRIYQKPMPQGKHSRLQLKLCTAVNQVTEEQQIALAFSQLRCTFGTRSIVPDVAVFFWQRIPFDADGEIGNAFKIYPDWTIEILSPNQNATKVISNILHCLKHGTQLGWFIDSREKIAIAFLPSQQPVELTGQDILLMPEFINLQLTVAQIFGWLIPRQL
ncbi:MAG: Uma2 family endonuclease [Chroococcus sp. CMT-3BRIN-NPC107]|jgi:Uma2 family endonuclease|nr:Uma2 family endonuclease [Chroococcus sp. CMT-3BRIN-NPC107]